MLALHYKTGKMAWGYQEVHHDTWDLDASSQPVMIRAKIKGKMVEGDRSKQQGRLLLLRQRAKRKAGLSDPGKAGADQRGRGRLADAADPDDAAVPASGPQLEAVAELQKLVNEAAAKAVLRLPTVTSGLGFEGKDLFYPWGLGKEPRSGSARSAEAEIVRRRLATTRHRRPVCLRCGRQGTVRWARRSNHADKAGRRIRWLRAGTSRTVRGYQAANSAGAHGFVTAYNMHTGKIIWQDLWPHECYSGELSTEVICCSSATTKAKSSRTTRRTGKEFWHLDLGAGGGIATSFEFKGREYVAVYAGGNEEGKIPQGDNLWAFTLNGKGPKGIALGKTPQPKKKIKE